MCMAEHLPTNYRMPLHLCVCNPQYGGSWKHSAYFPRCKLHARVSIEVMIKGGMLHIIRVFIGCTCVCVCVCLRG